MKARGGPPRASLRTRLTAAVGAIVIVTVAVAFAAVYHQTDVQLRSQLDTQLRSSARQLAAAMADGADSDPAAALARAHLYIDDQPYRNAAVLLFAVVPGVGTASNHAELVTANAPDDGESAREQTIENAQAQRIRDAGAGLSTVSGPDIGQLRIDQEALEVGGQRLYAGAGEPLTGVDAALDGVGRSFILAGAIALALTLAAAFLLGTRISRPLRHGAGVAARVDGGDLTPRLTPSRTAGTELHVLTEAFNRMLDRLAHAFASQRAFVADASHELRTPLTVIRGQLELLEDANADALAGRSAPVSPQEVSRVGQLVQVEIARITRMTDDLLVLALSDQDDFLHLDHVELQPFLTDLWDGLSLVADRRFEVGEIPPVLLLADADRLAQALRNVALNAVHHTAEPDGEVRLEVTSLPGRLDILISDDGPGIPEADRARVFERFFRTDPARSRAQGGAGLGLSIVNAIVSAHGGTVAVESSALGGAAFRISLPT